MPYRARSTSFVAARTARAADRDEVTAGSDSSAVAEPARVRAGRALPSTPCRMDSSGIGSSAQTARPSNVRTPAGLAQLVGWVRANAQVVSERQGTRLTPALREQRVLNHYRRVSA